jgi:hypothetical protein
VISSYGIYCSCISIFLISFVFCSCVRGNQGDTGGYTDFDFAADEREYAQYAAVHSKAEPYQQSQSGHTSNVGYDLADSYDDPYAAAELPGLFISHFVLLVLYLRPHASLTAC